MHSNSPGQTTRTFIPNEQPFESNHDAKCFFKTEEQTWRNSHIWCNGVKTSSWGLTSALQIRRAIKNNSKQQTFPA